MLDELADIMNRIHAYNVVHKDGCFLFSFVGWKKDEENICEDCGEAVEEYDENRSRIGAYGDLETLRIMNNELRDMIEDCAEDGFVNT